MGDPGAKEFIIAANHFLFEAREKINNIHLDENNAVDALKSLCISFDYLGKANRLDESVKIDKLSIEDSISGSLMAMAMTLHMGFNNTIGAIACLEAAIAVHRKPVYHFMAGQLYFQAGVKKSSFEHFKAAVELEPGDEDYMNAFKQICQQI